MRAARGLVLWALVLLAIFGALATFSVVKVALRPPPAPEIEPPPPAMPPLSEHVLFIIIDGLRYDVGTDAARMPFMADAMQRHTSAEMWAGRVSMSSSAILGYGTGQWGQLDLLLLNMFPEPPAFNTWIENGARGLVLGIVGERSWIKMFGEHIALQRPDPRGVAIEADLNEQNFRDTRELLRAKPNFIAAQFTTPDHQGHVHGIISDAYARHMRGFDRGLHQLLSEVGPEWTVIVGSDHGAADSGTHGTDAPIQRRTPIYAYGPGIRDGVKVERRVDQIELANTFAVLLGVGAPAHSRGHTLVEWLDVDAEGVRAVSCAEAHRMARYATAAGMGDETSAEVTAICDGRAADAAARSRALVSRVGRLIASQSGFASTRFWWLLAVVTALALVMAVLLYGKRVVGTLPLAVALTAVGVLLTFYVERFDGHAPNVIRATILVVVNLLTLGALLAPARLSEWMDNHPTVAPVLLPGMLVASYTANTRPMSWVAVMAITVLFVRTSPSKLSGMRLAGVLAALAVLLPPAIRESHHWGDFVLRSRPIMLAAAVLAILVWSVTRAARRGWTNEERFAVLCGAPVAMAAVAARSFATPVLGRLLVATLLCSAVYYASKRRCSLSVHFAIAGYGMLMSKDIQMVPVLATVAVAELLGELLGQRKKQAVALSVTFAVALLWVQRVAIQGGMDIGDFAPAATFGDSSPPWTIVGLAVTMRWLVPALVVLHCLTARLGEVSAASLSKAVMLTEMSRVVMLLFILAFCGSSYWTGLRVLGELPFALLGAVAGALWWVTQDPRATRVA